MKTFIYSIALTIMLALSLNAMPFEKNSNVLQPKNSTVEAKFAPVFSPSALDGMQNDYIIKSNKPTVTLLADENAHDTSEKWYYNQGIFFANNGQWTGYFNRTSPTAYDPISDNVFYARYRYLNTTAIGTVQLRILENPTMERVQDINNWVIDSIGAFPDNLVVNPSIAVMNTNEAQDFRSMDFFCYARYAVPSNNYAWGGAWSAWYHGGYDSYDAKGPTTGPNASGYLYPDANLSFYKKNGEPCATAASMLSPKTDSDQYGLYGQLSITLDDYNIYSSIPAAWTLDKFFRFGEEQFTTSYNSKPLTDADDKGNVYFSVLNFFKANDEDSARAPGVSKSSDKGNTWSSFNMCPFSLLAQEAVKQGGFLRFPDREDLPQGFTPGELYACFPAPYKSNAFVVYGEDNYSYFTVFQWVWIDESAEADLRYKVKGSIYEINSNNNVWTMKEVAPVTNVNGYRLFQGASNGDSLVYAACGHDIHVATTADSKDVILTWVDETELVSLNGSVQLPIYSGPIDSLVTTDIFGAYRTIGNSNWTTAQLTKDWYPNKLHKMPRVVANINKVPVFGHYSWINPDATTQTPEDVVRFAYPFRFKQFLIDAQQVMFLNMFDFNNATKYYPPTDVKENVVISTLNAPVPNPANNAAEITFSLDKDVNSSVEIFDVLGNRVEVLQNGFLAAGSYGLNVNTSKLSSGTYYIVLTANGAKTTQVLNVAK